MSQHLLCHKAFVKLPFFVSSYIFSKRTFICPCAKVVVFPPLQPPAQLLDWLPAEGHYSPSSLGAGSRPSEKEAVPWLGVTSTNEVLVFRYFSPPAVQQLLDDPLGLFTQHGATRKESSWLGPVSSTISPSVVTPAACRAMDRVTLLQPG